jgi:hypothetical protein
MTRHDRRRAASVLVGALAQSSVWLLTRPDLAGPEWTDGAVFELWLAAEALIAFLIGATGPDRRAVVVTVLVGWGLQLAHFAVLGEHYDDSLWATGLVVQIALAAAAVGLALLGRRLGGPPRRRRRT